MESYTKSIWQFGIINALSKRSIASVEHFSSPSTYPVMVTPLSEQEKGWSVLLRVNIASCIVYFSGVNNKRCRRFFEVILAVQTKRNSKYTLEWHTATLVHLDLMCIINLLKCLKTRLIDSFFNFQQVSSVYCVVINSTRPVSSKIICVFHTAWFLALWLLLCKQQLDNQIPCTTASILIYSFIGLFYMVCKI